MPDLNAFEDDRDAVLADLRRGEFDYLEVASRVTEARFFRYLLEQGDLKRWPEATRRRARRRRCRCGSTWRASSPFGSTASTPTRPSPTSCTAGGFGTRWGPGRWR